MYGAFFVKIKESPSGSELCVVPVQMRALKLEVLGSVICPLGS